MKSKKCTYVVVIIRAAAILWIVVEISNSVIVLKKL